MPDTVLSRSPFPGMDPYLEYYWGDMHASLIVYVRDGLQESLPPGLRARIGERVFLEGPVADPDRRFFPDVSVVEARPRLERAHAPGRGAGTALLERPIEEEPVAVRIAQDLLVEDVTEGFIEIRDGKSGNRLVTIIEVVSPSNKRSGEGHRKYVQKQAEAFSGGVSFVEIDLLRAGGRIMLAPDAIPETHRTHYQVFVRRGWEPEFVHVYRAPLQRPLPVISVPLREGEAEAHLALQPLIEQAYHRGRYAEDIDYSVSPDPPLSPEDEAWADALLREQGLRPAPA